MTTAATSPRFQGENFRKNLELVQKIEETAAAKGCTPSQLALAWVLAQGEDIVPIPGTKRVSYLDENLGAAHVRLTADDLAQIDAILPMDAASGPRTTPRRCRQLTGSSFLSLVDCRTEPDREQESARAMERRVRPC